MIAIGIGMVFGFIVGAATMCAFAMHVIRKVDRA